MRQWRGRRVHTVEAGKVSLKIFSGRGGGGEEQEGVLLACCVCFVDKLCLLPIIMALGSRLSEQALSGMFAYVAERRKKKIEKIPASSSSFCLNEVLTC